MAARATRSAKASSAPAAAKPANPKSTASPTPALVLSSRLANANRVPITLKPTPKIVRQEVNGQRFYKVDGVNELYPSVTTVLDIVGKPGLYAWERKMFSASLKTAILSELTEDAWLRKATTVQKEGWVDRLVTSAQTSPNVERDYASGFGSHAHNTFDVLLKGGEPAITDQQRAVTAGFHKFVNTCGLELHGDLSEVFVFSEKYRYAGAMDAIGWRQKPDGTRAFVALDWKTSKATRSEYALQLAAYSRAFEELQGVKVTEAWVVRFEKTRPHFEIKKVLDIDRSFSTFLSALQLWRFFNTVTPVWDSQGANLSGATGNKK